MLLSGYSCFDLTIEMLASAQKSSRQILVPISRPANGIQSPHHSSLVKILLCSWIPNLAITSSQKSSESQFTMLSNRTAKWFHDSQNSNLVADPACITVPGANIGLVSEPCLV